MKIQFNTDKNIKGKEALEAYMSDKISSGLKQFDERITRIEVHLSDQNAHKTGTDDIHCKLEARVEGLQPMTVTGKDGSKEKAVKDAISKMKAMLSTTLGKMKDA